MLVAAVLSGGCNGVKLPTSTASAVPIALTPATDSQRNSGRPSGPASTKFDTTCSASTCWPRWLSWSGDIFRG